MSTDRAIPAEQVPVPRFPGLETAAPADQQQVNIVKLIHRNLRGRYLLAGILAGVFGLGGAAAGYFVPTPKYRSEGWLDVRSTIVTATSDQTNIMPMFTNFVNKQVRLLQDDRVIQQAMNSEEWRAFKRPRTPETMLDFKSSITVTTAPGAQDLILVSFTDEKAEAALQGLRQTVIAYQNIYGDQGTEKAKLAQTQVLRDKQAKLTEDKRKLQTNIDFARKEFARDHGSDDFLQLSDRLSKQHFDLKDRLAVMRFALLERGVDPDKKDAAEDQQPGAAPASSPAAEPKTAEELALLDRDIAQLFEARNRAARNLDLLIAKGRLPQHPERARAEIELDAVQKDLAARVEAWNANPKAATAAAPVAGTAAPVQTVAEQKVAFQNLSSQAESLAAVLARVNSDRDRIALMQTQLKDADTELEAVNSRLEKMALDTAVEKQIGRVEANIPDKGDVPQILNADPRKKFAALGLVAGGGLPVAILFLLGLLDRRFRYADQADDEVGTSRLLGILPDLPTTTDDPEQVAAAVHSVHHIRSRLQLSNAPHQIYLVTSPTSGDGKTSLSLSLAVSFTASGARVLLVDFDLIGHGLTSQLGLSRPRGIGHKLVDGDLTDLIVDTAVSGLSLIPAGNDDASCAPRISRKSLGNLLDSLRTQFDTIIVDTGPILGSLEANLAATLTDGVVIVVGRGQQGSYMQETTRHLQQIGARIAGVVFNRAHTTDFNRSTTVNASFRSIRSAAEAAAKSPPPEAAPGFERLGTLARRVAIDARR